MEETYDWERDEVEEIIWNTFHKNNDIDLAPFLPKLSKYNGIDALKEALNKCNIPSDNSLNMWNYTNDIQYLEVFRKNIDTVNFSILNSCKPDKYIFDLLKEMSIHNADSDTLTLGKFRTSKNIDGTDNWKIAREDSYNVIAEKNGDMYFDMKGGLYDEIQKNYNLSYQDIFDEFNTAALDKAISENKVIRFSHNPELSEYAGSFTDQEWKYLQKMDATYI